MNVNVFDQLQDVAQVVRRCPNPTLVAAYVRAARKFCTETRWLRREVVGVTVAGTRQYSLGSDDDLDIVGIRAMTGASSTPNQSWPLTPADPTGWNSNAQPGMPRQYCYVPEGQFAVHVPPDAAYTLTVTVEVAPKKGTTVLPEELLVKWDRGIADGATEYLLNLPQQPWSNPALAAQKYGRQMQAAINNARGEVQRAFNTGTSMARIPRRF